MNALQHNAPPTEEPQETGGLIKLDGYWVDPETGERVAKEGFHVTDIPSAEWLLEKLQGLDADMAAIDNRKALVIANLDTMKAHKQRQYNGLLYKYRLELEAFAKEQLEGSKLRSWVCPFGAVKFRYVNASYKLNPEMEEQCLEWCERNLPDAVKVTKKVLVSQIPDITRANLKFFEEVPESESCTVVTK